MIRLIRSLIGLPLEVLGGVLAVLGVPACVGLLTAAWWINGNPRTAVRALAQVRRHEGPDAAREQAQSWLARRCHSELAAFAGLLYLDADELTAAEACLDLGRQIGPDADGNLELLEYHLAARSGDPTAAGRLARQLEPRRDLNALTRRLVLEERLWQELLARRYDAAGEYGRHLLEVANDPQASMAMWAVETARGRPQRAAENLAAATMPEPQYSFYRYLAATAVDDRAAVDEALARLGETDPMLVQRARAEVARQREAAWT